jgi:hypothetical protein
MQERGGGAGLGVKPFEQIRRRPFAAADQLERYFAPEAAVAGPEDDAHAAAGDFLQQIKRPHGPSRRIGGRFRPGPADRVQRPDHQAMRAESGCHAGPQRVAA